MMNVFTVRKEVEQGQEVFFCYRNHTVVSRHKSANTAWNSAESKAHSLAAKNGQAAQYTTCPDEYRPADEPSPRAAWIVK